jgi:MraZ protein
VGRCGVKWPNEPDSMPRNSQSPPIFAGTFQHALDDKNRVTIPARWRSGDADEFFVVQHTVQPCLIALPPAVFNHIGNDKSEHPDVTPQQRALFNRRFFSKALHCPTDKQGRLLLTDEFCKSAKLRGTILVVGSRDRFEIWNETEWKKFSEGADSTYRNVAELMGV